jgi:hypothetical protein
MALTRWRSASAWLSRISFAHPRLNTNSTLAHLLNHLLPHITYLSFKNGCWVLIDNIAKRKGGKISRKAQVIIPGFDCPSITIGPG